MSTPRCCQRFDFQLAQKRRDLAGIAHKAALQEAAGRLTPGTRSKLEAAQLELERSKAANLEHETEDEHA